MSDAGFGVRFTAGRSPPTFGRGAMGGVGGARGGRGAPHGWARSGLPHSGLPHGILPHGAVGWG